MLDKLVGLVSGLAVAACSVVGIRSGTEEPAYRVIAHVGAVEIREYGERLAAETAVEGDEMAARSTGFRRVAGYIFGANKSQAKIAMTAPVAQASEKIAMTAPVAQERDAQGRWVIQFYMPAEYTRQTLPEPTDPLVRIVSVPKQTVGVLRFSGVPTSTSVADETATLMTALENSAWKPAGQPFAWFYDPPWTIPPLRRNEVVVAVKQE